jgi:metacaspase-1
MARLPNFYALLIGVSEYDHFRSLPQAGNDAQLIYSTLTSENLCGYEPNNVTLVPGDRCNLPNIRSAFRTLAKRANTNDTVFIFFSGHGGCTNDHGLLHVYLCAREADPEDLVTTGLSEEEFSALLANIKCSRMLIALDACHASGIADLTHSTPKGLSRLRQWFSLFLEGVRSVTGTGIANWRPGLPPEFYEEVSEGEGRAVIASCTADQYSHVRKQGDTSLFTHHLVQGLMGGAAVRADGFIRVFDLFHHVNTKVHKEEPSQEPVLQAQHMKKNFAIGLDRGGFGDVSSNELANVTRDTPDVHSQSLLEIIRPTEHLRFRSPNFVGREAELKRLTQSIQDEGSVALYAVRGMGGVGKSALAAELAATVDDPGRYPGGVLWANLAEEAPTLIAARWLRNYGSELSFDTEESRLARLATFLGLAPAFIVLDNAQEAESVHKLLFRAAGVSVIVTTRKQATIPSVVKSFSLDQLSPEESIELLSKRIGHTWVAAEEEAGRRICELCGYLPLALTLAGAHIAQPGRWSTLEEYRTKLENKRMDMLSRSDISQDNIRMTFDVSYEDISNPDIRALFAQLSLFASQGFSISAVAALIGANGESAEQALDQLADLSLIVRNGHRFLLHDLLREYAEEKLQEVPNATINTGKQQLILHYHDFAKDNQGSFGTLENDRDNLLRAISWAQNEQGSDLLDSAMIDLVGILTAYFRDTGQWVEAVKVTESAFHTAEARGLVPTQADLAQSISWIYNYQEDFDRAEEWARRSLELYGKVNQPYGEAVATRRLGMILQDEGKTDEGREYLENALAAFRKLETFDRVADTLTALGYLERKAGNLELAERNLNEAMSIVEDIHEEREITLVLYQQGRLEWARGNLDAARERLTRALEIDIARKRIPGIAYAKHRLGEIEARQGNVDAAIELLADARRIFAAMGASKRVKRIEDQIGELKSTK